MQKGDFKPQVTMPEGSEWPVEFEKQSHYRVAEDGTYQILTEHGWENLLKTRRRADGTYQIPITYEGKGSPHEEELTDDDGYLVSEEPKPRRYEVRDAETGEKLSGVSFILTPTGEEMHLLTEPGHSVGPMKDIGVYYHGHTTNEETGNNSLPAIRPMALKWMAERIIRELANLGPHHPHYDERRHYGNMKMIAGIGAYAVARYERYAEESAEFIAEHERKEQERRESFRKSMVAKGLMGQRDNGPNETTA